MDKFPGARQHSEATAVSDNTSDLLKGRRARETNGIKPARPAPDVRRNGNGYGRDPERTEEIFGDSNGDDRHSQRSTPARAARQITPPLKLERTHPVTSHSFDESEHASRLPAGTLLANRYLILDDVQASGMGHVYKAIDRQRESAGAAEPWVALKIARPVRSTRSDTAAYLRQEFLKLSRLRHPHIVAAYDLGTDRGRDFMVLEWLQGETLAAMLERINSKRVALRTAQEVVTNVASALAHAHAAGIVHGDVKPSNIFLTNEHSVKLIDFGAGVQSSPDTDDDDHEQSWATRAYASCEILQGQTPQPSDDVFALGVTAYLLLSGERPFGELDALDARDRGIVPADLPDDAFADRAAVRAALQLDAVERPADAREFMQLLADDPEEAKTSTFPLPVPAHFMAIAWGALAAMVLGLTVWWSIPGDGAAPPRAERLLAAAGQAVAAGRLVGAENSAFGYYSDVLVREPENAEALQGLDDIAEHFLSRARSALTAEDFDAAVDNFDIARRVRPAHFGIAPTEDLLARYRRDLLVSARQAAEFNVNLADQYLARAAALSDADDPSIASVRAELERHRVAEQVEELLRGIDDRILAERLLVPAGDSAVDLLRRAKGIASGDRDVQLAADRLASALLFQAMFSISSGNLGDAQSFIDAAKSLEVRHLALARAEYELAKAQHEMLTDAN